MTYQEAKQTPQAKNWTIAKINGAFQPKHLGLAIGIAHKTIDAARLYIMSNISYDQNAQSREDEKNRLYRDFDIC